MIGTSNADSLSYWSRSLSSECIEQAFEIDGQSALWVVEIWILVSNNLWHQHFQSDRPLREKSNNPSKSSIHNASIHIISTKAEFTAEISANCGLPAFLVRMWLRQ